MGAALRQTGWGLFPNLAGQYIGEGAECNKRDLLGPPTAIEVCPSDQLRPSLKPSLDFDLQEGANNRKGEQWNKRGENRAKCDSFELPVCEVPIIPFMLRQEMADTVRKGLIKHCCHNQGGLNVGPTQNHSVVLFQTPLHINLDYRALCICECIHGLLRPTRAEHACQNRGERLSMER